MNKIWRLSIIVLVLLSLGSLLGMYYIGESSAKNKQAKTDLIENGSVAGVTSVESEDYLSRLTKKMTENGMVLYCSYQAEDCKKQKELFGQAINNINYVECDASIAHSNPDECLSHEVSIYPTWLYEEEKYTGIRSLSELARLVNFN